MTALSSSFRINNNSTFPTTGLNKHFQYSYSEVNAVDNHSTIIKESGNISHTNKFEIQKLKSFSELEKNWDSYDAEKINERAILSAIKLVIEIDSLGEEVYFSSPGPNGEVMIQLKKNMKEVEFIIYQDKQMYVTFNNNDFEKQGEFSIELLADIILWLNK